MIHIGMLVIYWYLLSYFFPIFGIWGEAIKLHKHSQLQVIELIKEITKRQGSRSGTERK